MGNKKLFFGVGAGRCGTMFLANILNLEVEATCCHEGYIRECEEKRQQILPYLTLENRIAYEEGEETAIQILREKRENQISELLSNGNHFGDIAYYYAPFVSSLTAVFPDAKIIVITRKCSSFVRSVITEEVPDPTPVGWQDSGRRLSETEKFIEFGRLRPVDDRIGERNWDDCQTVVKNVWLWNETYRIILSGLKPWNPESVLVVRSEELFSDPETKYNEIRGFLGFTNEITEKAKSMLQIRVNPRKESAKILGEFTTWPQEVRMMSEELAAETSAILGYEGI